MENFYDVQKQKDQDFKAILGYIVSSEDSLGCIRPFLKTNNSKIQVCIIYMLIILKEQCTVHHLENLRGLPPEALA